MPKAVKLTGIVAIFLCGVLLAATVASGGGTTDTTTTVETTTTETTTPETSTDVETSTTVETTPTADTTTVSVTTTRFVPVGTAEESSSSGTAAWVWVLLAILGVALVALVVLLARRGGHSGGGGPGGTPRAKLDAAVGSWVAQGWAIESQTSDSAVLRRGGETMLVSVDESGHVGTRPFSSSN